MRAGVLVIQGAGAGAHAEDALLVSSLRHHLGPEFEVEYPWLPDEDEADDDRWETAIADALETAPRPLVVVGHSAGGYPLLKALLTAPPTGLRAICLLAVPFPGADPVWTFDGFDLPSGFGERLPQDARVFLYASPDDDTVPFAHRDHYASEIPRAVTRTLPGGHQFGNDLRVVADDIRSVFLGRDDHPRG